MTETDIVMQCKVDKQRLRDVCKRGLDEGYHLNYVCSMVKALVAKSLIEYVIIDSEVYIQERNPDATE